MWTLMVGLTVWFFRWAWHAHLGPVTQHGMRVIFLIALVLFALTLFWRKVTP